jgi:hypothetical protein
VQVIEYVEEPALARVTDIVPESETLPAQPSPLDPPAAEHASALVEFQVSVTASPATWLDRFEVKVAEGRGAAEDSPDTSPVYVMATLSISPLQSRA